MVFKADLKDFRILAELDADARQPFSAIGKKIRISQPAVSYRVERLKAAGILKGCVAIPNMAKLGYRYYHVSLKLKHITEEEEHFALEELKRMPEVSWLVTTTGEYQLMLAIVAKEIANFQRAFNNIIRVLQNEIIEHVMFVVMDVHQLPYSLPVKQEQTLISKKNEIKMTEFSTLLLQELVRDVRITSLELARKFNINPKTASYQLNKLLASDMIVACKPLIDMTKLGYAWYLTLFRLNYVEEKEQKRFTEYLKTLPQTFFVVNGVGNWSMQVEFYCKDDKEYRDLMSRIFSGDFKNIVKEVVELRIREEHKCLFFSVELPKD